MADESLISSHKGLQCFYTFSQPYSGTNFKSENSLECRVCEEGFNLGGDKIPRLLFCGHTLCHACLLRLPVNENIIHCPFDRQPTPIGSSGVWSLKKNFALLELLEKLSHKGTTLSPEILSKQKEYGVCCDENEEHVAVLYCTVCASHLCLECSEATHATKTLHRHKRIPLSEKPREKPRCIDHSSHPVEFVCLEEECQNANLMCFICKDYKHTKHKHALLEQEAEKIRNAISSAIQNIKKVAQELTLISHKLDNVRRDLGGALGECAGNDSENTGIASKNAQVRVQQYFEQLREQLAQQEIQAQSALDTYIRERLCTVRQQQEDITALLSEMVSVVVDGERSIQQDDGRLIVASQDLTTRLAQVSVQEQQLSHLTIWDVGGQPKLRPLWRHYYFNTQAVIFVIDASDADRFPEAQAELTKLMTEKELKDALFLIYANKSDCCNALSVSAITDALGLHKLCFGRSWHIQSCDAQSGAGLQQGLDWLAQQLVPSDLISTI